MLTDAEILANRKVWTDALRGNGKRKYAQTRGKLASKGYRSFCCLGVYADATGMTRIGELGGKFGEVFPACFASPDGEKLDAELSPMQLAALGLSNDMQVFLIRLNDISKARFAAIADAIDALPITRETGEPFNEYAFLGDRPELAKALRAAP